MPRRQEEEDRTIQKTEETTVPLTEEKLDVSKRTSAKEATITKKPVTETKTVEVPVTHEEISVERRPTSSNTTTTTADSPVESEEEIRVPLKEEGIVVTKKPYVKEEVSLKVAVVTGCSTGIGLETCLLFARNGSTYATMRDLIKADLIKKIAEKEKLPLKVI